MKNLKSLIKAHRWISDEADLQLLCVEPQVVGAAKWGGNLGQGTGEKKTLIMVGVTTMWNVSDLRKRLNKARREFLMCVIGIGDGC